MNTMLRNRILGIWISLLSAAMVLNANAQSEKPDVLDPSQLVYLYTDEGLVVIELAPFFAPQHVQRFTQLVTSGFYDGLPFYRVIDGFVAQGGDASGERETEYNKPLAPEFSRPNTSFKDAFTAIQTPAFLAESTGFIQGFPAGQSNTDNQQWLLHCPGAVAFARGNEANSATTEFYIVIGQAPRHLDRNMSIFGQVVYGLDKVQRFMRGDANMNGGVIDADKPQTTIKRAVLGGQVANDDRVVLRRDAVSSEAFSNRITSARSLDNPFYHYKGTGNIDVCYYRPRVVAD